MKRLVSNLLIAYAVVSGTVRGIRGAIKEANR